MQVVSTLKRPHHHTNLRTANRILAAKLSRCETSGKNKLWLSAGQSSTRPQREAEAEMCCSELGYRDLQAREKSRDSPADDDI